MDDNFPPGRQLTYLWLQIEPSYWTPPRNVYLFVAGDTCKHLNIKYIYQKVDKSNPSFKTKCDFQGLRKLFPQFTAASPCKYRWWDDLKMIKLGGCPANHTMGKSQCLFTGGIKHCFRSKILHFSWFLAWNTCVGFNWTNMDQQLVFFFSCRTAMSLTRITCLLDRKNLRIFDQ